MSCSQVPFHFSFDVALLERMSFIVGLFPLADAELDFQMPTGEVELQGNEREALFMNFLRELANLFFVREKFSNADGIVVMDVALFERTDMKVVQQQLAFLDRGIRILYVQFTFTNGFYLSASQHDADLDCFKHMIFVPRPPVGEDDFAIFRVRLHSSDSRNDAGQK